MQLSAGTKIGNYEILSLLGKGGMGVVYRATDTNLNRSAAVKVLSGDLADAAARRRFQREAQTASSLNHPHIVTVYDAGEWQGCQYLITEFVDGGTLADWARAEKRSWRQIIELLTGVADALATTHASGILHRDIKPANILVSKNGYAKLADFGLAKLEEIPVAENEQTRTLTAHRTHPGMILGTIAYMSPEQASAQPLDARSDIFSFGVVLYELLCGHRPFRGATDLEVLQTILHGSPQPFPESVPPEVRTVVEKALEKDPAERYQTMADMVVDLRKLTRRAAEPVSPSVSSAAAPAESSTFPPAVPWTWLAVAALVALIAFGAWKLWPRTASTQIHSIAVLPLANLSGDPTQEFFSDGITEELIEKLGQIHSLQITSRTSIMRYKDSKKSLPEIAQDLGVDAILEGSIRRSGNQVRITAQLIQASNEKHLWAEDYDRDLSDVLKLEGEVAQIIAQEIQAQVTPEETKRLATVRSVLPEALEQYRLGRYEYHRLDFKQASAHFEQAIQLQPDYAAAYAGLSIAQSRTATSSLSAVQRGAEDAGYNAAQALKYDPNLSDAHLALALKDSGDWEWAAADKELQQARALNSNSVEVGALAADQMIVRGRFPEAIAILDHNLQIDPLSADVHTEYGIALFVSRHYPEAEVHYNRVLELAPQSLGTHVVLAGIYKKQGKFKEALAELDRPGLHGGTAEGVIYAAMGRRQDAQKILAEATKPGANTGALGLAQLYFALGDKDRGFPWLTKAFDAHTSFLRWADVDPTYDDVRSDPRFQALVTRLKLNK